MKVRKLELGEKYVQEKGLISIVRSKTDFVIFLDVDDGGRYISFREKWGVQMNNGLIENLYADEDYPVYRVEK